jgi:hypothetical protein
VGGRLRKDQRPLKRQDITRLRAKREGAGEREREGLSKVMEKRNRA